MIRLAIAAYLCTLLFALPICLLALQFRRLSATTVFIAGVIFTSGFNAIGIAVDSWSPSGWTLPPAWYFIQGVPAIFCGCLLPFAAFALYLAHLRRRDLRRAAD